MGKTTWISLGTALAIGAGLWLWTAKKKPQPVPPPPASAMLLMRHLEVPDLKRIWNGEPTSVLGPADLFVYGHDGIYENQVTALVLDSLRVHRYFNCLLVPLPIWVDRGSVWLDFAAHTIHERWGAVVKDSLGVKARWQWEGQPLMFDWSAIGKARADTIAAVQMSLLGDARDAFLDQFWSTPRYWFFPAGSLAFGDITPAEMEAWRTNILYFAETMRKAVAARGGIVILNGDPDAPPPVFLENANWHPLLGGWRAAVERWKRHPANVLSVDVGSGYEDSLIAAWTQRRGGTVSFTGIGLGDDLVRTQPFYLRADQARRTVLAK